MDAGTPNNERDGRPNNGRPSDFNAKGTLRLVLLVAQTIQELGSIPSGHLYARLMGHIDLETYQSVIATLVRSGLVREHPSHLLQWVGPQPTTSSTTHTNN